MSFDNLSGQMLGQYQLLELLGQGGMGTVYRSIQPSLNQEVAVKILPASLAQQPGYLERFNREAQIAANLEHPHIIPTFDYGMQRGVSYVVMRLLRGGTLGQRINQRRTDNQPLCSLGEVSSMLNQMASALDYAHSQGVIHRDIKTNNIMFDNQGNAYLVDFGIAKLADETHGLTRAGAVVGTPSYMPPEQWEDRKLTPAADQYALAVVIYLLVSGRMPFEAESQPALMRKHLHDMPTPPHIIRPNVPEAVQTVLERALAKNPEERFPTVTSFAQAFQRAITGYEGKSTGFFTFKFQNVLSPPPIITPSRPYTPPPIVPPLTPHPPTEIQRPVTGGNSNRMFWVLGAVIVALIAVIVLLVLNLNRGVGVASVPTPTETALPSPSFTLTFTSTATESVIVPPPPTQTWTATAAASETPTATSTWTATVTPSETPTASLTSTATYTLTSSATSTFTSTATLTATPTASQTHTPTLVPLSIHSFSTSTSNSTPGSSITLTWKTVSDHVQINEFDSKSALSRTFDVLTTGSLDVTIPQGATNYIMYQLVATGGGQQQTSLITIFLPNATATMTPTPAPTAASLIINTFGTSTSNSTPGSSITLTWKTVSDRVRINEFNSKGLTRIFEVNTSGSMIVTIPQGATNYIMYQLVATGGGQQKTSLITILLPNATATMTPTPTRRPSMTPTPPAESIRFEFDRFAPGTGWSDPEYGDGTTFIWMNRTSSTLQLPVKTDRDLKLSIHIFMAMSDPILHSLTVKVNKQALPLTRTGNIAPATFTVTIPRGILAASRDLVQLEFGISGTIVPGNGDSRTLGIAFDWLTLNPVTISTPTPILSLSDRIVFTSNRYGNPEILALDLSPRGMPQRITDNRATDSRPVLSPDGHSIAFNSARDGKFRIYVISLDDMVVRRQTQDAISTNPSWSPDSKRIVFDALLNGKSQIYVLTVDNASRSLISPSDNFDDYDPTWSPDGSKIAFWSTRMSGNSDIYTIASDGSGLTNLTFNTGEDRDPAWAPDGKKIAFASNREGNYEIYVMDANGSNQRRLTNSDGTVEEPTWSPDGQYIAFVSNQAGNKDIWVMKSDGTGSPIDLTADSTSDDYDPNWGLAPNTAVALSVTNTPTPSGTSTSIFYQNDFSNGTAGGLNISDFKIQDFMGDKDYCGQAALNGSGSIFGGLQSNFTVEAPVYILKQGTNHWWIELRVRSNESWTSGYSLYIEPDGAHLRRADGTVLAERLFTPVDNGKYTLRMTVNKDLIVAYVNGVIVGSEKNDNTYVSGWSGIGGGNVKFCIDQITMRTLNGDNAASVGNSPDTILPGRIAFTSWRYTNSDIFIMDPSSPSQPLRLTNDTSVDEHPVISPDGKTVAFDSKRSGNFNIYDIQIGQNDVQTITSDNRGGVNPTWSSDGKQIAFSTAGFGAQQIYEVNVASKATQLVSLSNASSDTNPAWSPVDNTIAYESTKDGGHDIFVIFSNGLGSRNLTEGKGDNYDPAWSPDGKQIAFTSNRSGGNNFEIYVMDANGSNIRRLTYSRFKDEQPTWSPDGQYIAFVSNQEKNKDIWVMRLDRVGAPINLTADSTADDYDPNWGPAAGVPVALAATNTPTPASTNTPQPTATKIPFLGVLYSQDFSKTITSELSGEGWALNKNEQAYCIDNTNSRYGDFPSVAITPRDFKESYNYSIEVRVRFTSKSGHLAILTRLDPNGLGYRHSVDFSATSYGAGQYYYGAQADLGYANIYVRGNTWYTLRAEVDGSTIRTFLNGQLAATIKDTHRDRGTKSIEAGPNVQVCIDDLVVRSLDRSDAAISEADKGKITNNAKLRLGPGTDFAAVSNVIKGETVFILGSDPTGKWVLVRRDQSNGIQGWVSTDFIQNAS